MMDFEECLVACTEAVPEVLDALLATGGTWADLFVEQTIHHRFGLRQTLRDGRLRPAQAQTRREVIEGAGLRVLGDEEDGFVATPDLSPGGLLDAAATAAAALPFAPPSAGAVPWTTCETHLDVADDAPDRIRPSEKATVLEAAADAAFSLDPRVHRVEVRYHDRVRRTLIATADGIYAAQATLLIGLRVEVDLHAGDGTVTAHAVGGGTAGFGRFFEVPPEQLARQAVDRARRLADARPLPPGARTVVLAPGWGGVWLHEAVGHLLEADVVGTGASPLAGWDGGRVADETVTLIDDATRPGGRGTLAFDDEGTPARTTTLIDGGVLRGLLTDRRWADRLDRPRTGNGRRQDYRHRPLPRMTNLILHPGTTAPADLIAGVDDGLYVLQIGHGQTHPDGRFRFDVLEGTRIERGRLTHPVTNVRITGSTLDALARITGLGHDLHIETARGLCKKSGQIVPVTVGMPTVRIEGMGVVMRDG